MTRRRRRPRNYRDYIKKFRRVCWTTDRLKLLREFCKIKLYDTTGRIIDRRTEEKTYQDKKFRACFVCNQPGNSRHHIIQSQHGGPDLLSNIVVLCWECHRRVHGHIN